MFEYLMVNKEWIFSGVGCSALFVIGGWLLRSFKSKQKIISFSRNAEVESQKITVDLYQKNILPDTEVLNISKRFLKILELMNEHRSYSKFTIAGLAQIMKLSSVGELESVFSGNRDPSFEFVNQFCESFGINKNWLLEGKEAPFIIDMDDYFNPFNYFELIEQLTVTRVYFIRSTSEVGQVFIVLKFADFNYRIIKRIWHISNHVGASGESQIFGMYKLIMALQKSVNGKHCGGRILSESLFRNLFNGNVFPGSVIEYLSEENLWWDDFIDVYNKYSTPSKYEKLYGNGFVKAQSIVRLKLTSEAVNCD